MDSVEYELIIIDPGFDTWLLTKPSKEYYSQNYYEQKNRLYVMEWNYRYMAGKDRGKYETYIDYLPGIDYGLDLNYKLFYYFKYFEETNNIMLDKYLKMKMIQSMQFNNFTVSLNLLFRFLFSVLCSLLCSNNYN